jgi:hypothetical protein
MKTAVRKNQWPSDAEMKAIRLRSLNVREHLETAGFHRPLRNSRPGRPEIERNVFSLT